MKTKRTIQIRPSRILLLAAPALILAVMSARPARAQVDASLAGTVRDVTGAGIAGATIHIESLETGKQRELNTDDAGRFRALALAVGQYNLTVQTLSSMRQQPEAHPPLPEWSPPPRQPRARYNWA